MKLLDMKQEQKAALDAASAVIATAERAGRNFTASEQETYTASMETYKGLGVTIRAREEMNTIRSIFPNGTPFGGASTPADMTPLRLATARNPEYAKALHGFLCTGGKEHSEDLTIGADGFGGYLIPGSEAYTRQRLANGSYPKMSAATYEGTEGGSNGAGGYAVSVPTLDLVTPLAMPDLGIFDASLIVATASDVKIPAAASFGTSAIKAESTGTIATFGGSDPTLSQTALTSFMAGAVRYASWELLQDVQSFQAYLTDDLIRGQRILEGSLLATGTGSGQPLGVFGNTGTGTGAAYELTGTTSSDGLLLLESLFDVTATLKGQYQAGAAWIMSRATGLAIRRAQMQSNLYIPIATTDPDGTERILGKPVFYDVNAPALPTATNAGVVPILYGDFKQGYIIGIRGGGGVNIKLLDQPFATAGQLAIMAYRRLDGRIRRSEAIQAVTVSHS